MLLSRQTPVGTRHKLVYIGHTQAGVSTHAYQHTCCRQAPLGYINWLAKAEDLRFLYINGLVWIFVSFSPNLHLLKTNVCGFLCHLFQILPLSLGQLLYMLSTWLAMLYFHVFLLLREMAVIFVLVIITKLLYWLTDNSYFSYSSESREVLGHCNTRFSV